VDLDGGRRGLQGLTVVEARPGLMVWFWTVTWNSGTGTTATAFILVVVLEWDLAGEHHMRGLTA
jgi:hypothetical protein